MQRYLVRRFFESIVTLIGVSIIVFIVTRVIGDPTVLLLPPDASPEERKTLIANLGLDRPLYRQYASFVNDALHFDLGRSFTLGRPVSELITKRLWNTLQLTMVAFVLSVSLGLGVGILSAVKRGSIYDSVGKTLALLGQATPGFWVGLMLILIFAVWWQVLPVSGMGDPSERIQHMILPAITMGWFSTAALLRLTRSSMLDVLESEYIKMERIKGAPERTIIYKHALKNAAIPVVTLMALQVAFIFQGSVVTETVFAWPGVGRLAVDAIIQRDYPLVQGVVLLGSFVYVFMNWIVDILYAYLNPRIRYT